MTIYIWIRQFLTKAKLATTWAKESKQIIGQTLQQVRNTPFNTNIYGMRYCNGKRLNAKINWIQSQSDYVIEHSICMSEICFCCIQIFFFYFLLLLFFFFFNFCLVAIFHSPRLTMHFKLECHLELVTSVEENQFN